MLSRLTIAAAAVFLAMGPAVADPYVYTTVDDPVALAGGGDTVVTGINDAGALTGYYRDTATSGTFHSFVEVGGVFTANDDPLDVGGATFSQGINNAGETAGYYTTNGGTIDHGFAEIGGSFTTIDVPGAVPGTTVVDAVNNAGTLVGYYAGADGNQHGFVDAAGHFTTVDDPAGTFGTDVIGINASGVLIGVYTDITGVHGFVDNGGVFTMTVDPAMSGFAAAPEGINDAGAFVGQYLDNANPNNNIPVSFLDAGGVFTTISDPLADLSLGGTVALGINNGGVVVGQYFDSTSGHGFVATPQSSAAVPEPNSWALLVGGLASFAALRRCAAKR